MQNWLYHDTDSITLVLSKDKLQPQMYMPATFQWKYVIPKTFLNDQSGLNTWSKTWSSA